MHLQILDEPEDKAAQVLDELVLAGIITPPPGHSHIEAVSDEAREEIAAALGRLPGKPLSEIIIEERGER